MARFAHLRTRVKYANVLATAAAIGAAVGIGIALGARSSAHATTGPLLPSVLGQAVIAAAARIDAAAGSVPVRITTRLVKSGDPLPGRVVAQSPAAGTRLSAGAEITLMVSAAR